MFNEVICSFILKFDDLSLLRNFFNRTCKLDCDVSLYTYRLALVQGLFYSKVLSDRTVRAITRELALRRAIKVPSITSKLIFKSGKFACGEKPGTRS